MYTHQKNVIAGGTPLAEAKKALILIHGRGASAESIMGLLPELKLENTAVLAPQASQSSWYPYSFMAPEDENQPALDSALDLIGSVVEEVIASGISTDKIFFLGFSQGACLTLEYVGRNPKSYGGIIAFTGGLIGEQLNAMRYQGDFLQTPVLISTGDPDPHVPLSRVKKSVSLFKKLNAAVIQKVYLGRPHTISFEEIELAREIMS